MHMYGYELCSFSSPYRFSFFFPNKTLNMYCSQHVCMRVSDVCICLYGVCVPAYARARAFHTGDGSLRCAPISLDEREKGRKGPRREESRDMKTETRTYRLSYPASTDDTRIQKLMNISIKKNFHPADSSVVRITFFQSLCINICIDIW